MDYDPDSFQETEALDAILDKRSKPELIAIIKEMLEQEPSLESLLDLPIIGEESKPITSTRFGYRRNGHFAM